MDGQAPEKRHHHFIPQLYLKEFTLGGQVDDEFWVLDKERTVQWVSTPRKSAHQRDFYRVELGDVCRPDSVEDAFAEVEAKIAPVLRQIITSRKLPPMSSYRFDVLLNFIAMMIARVPGSRDAMSEPMKALFRQIGHQLVGSPEQWEFHAARLKEKGIEADAVPYEEMRAFVIGEDYTISVDQNWEIKMMLQAIGYLLPLLAKRTWRLLIADDDAPDYICSDRPVAIRWIGEPPAPDWYSAGFGMPGTVVTFPLSRRLALWGYMEGYSARVRANVNFVAQTNAMTAGYATRFIYSGERDFCWLHRDGLRHTTAELIEAIRGSRKST